MCVSASGCPGSDGFCNRFEDPVRLRLPDIFFVQNYRAKARHPDPTEGIGRPLITGPRHRHWVPGADVVLPGVGWATLCLGALHKTRQGP